MYVDKEVSLTNQLGILHVVGFIAIVSVLGAMSSKHSASYVFTEFSNTSGWTNDGVSWLVGLLSTVYPFLGYEAPWLLEKTGVRAWTNDHVADMMPPAI